MSNSAEIRWKQRFDNFTKALAQLEQACQRGDYSDLERAGLVQMFEFSFDLAWKTLKDLLFFEGYDAKTPREVIRASFEVTLLSADDAEILLDALNKRNLLSHTYEAATALEAEVLITRQYTPLLVRLRDTLKEKHKP